MKILNINTFPLNDHSARIDDMLYLADNFTSTDAQQRELHMNDPIQVSMALVFLCIDGYIDFQINLKDYHLTPQHVATIPVNSFVIFKDFPLSFRGFLVAINPDFMDYSRDNKLGMAFMNNTSMDIIGFMPEQNMQEAIMLYKMMKTKLQDRDYIFKTECVKSILEILKYNGYQAMLHQKQMKPDNLIRSRKDEIYYMFTKLVNKYYREERQIAFYADRLNVTPKYLSTIVKQVSGKFATEWIDDFVILEAKAILKNETVGMKTICARLNFASPSLFTKYFKQHTGLTPKEYRNS